MSPRWGLQGEGRVFVHSVGLHPTLIYVAPSGLLYRGVCPIRRVAPYADLCRPFGTFRSGCVKIA